MFGVLDWIACVLTKDTTTFYGTHPQDIAHCGQSFQVGYERVFTFRMPCELNGVSGRVHPAVIWSALKQRGLAAFTTRTDSRGDTVYEVGDVTFPVSKLEEFSRLAKDVVAIAPLHDL